MRLISRLRYRCTTDLLEYALPDLKKNAHYPGYNVYIAIKNILSVKKTMTIPDWIKLRSVLSSPGFGYQSYCVLMHSHSGLPEVRKLITALESCGAMNPVLKAQMMPAFDIYASDCIEEDHKFVLGALDDILKFPVLTSDLANLALRALITAPLWKEKGNLITSKLGDKIDYSSYSLLANAAFYHKEYDLGWEYLKQAVPAGVSIHPRTYARILVCHEEDPKQNLLFKLLSFVEEHYFTLTLSIALELSSMLEKSGNWVSRLTHVKSSGQCECCKRKLQKLQLTAEEHSKLLNNVESTFALDCQFTTYQRKEVEEFKMFLKNCPPYSVVIDGPNLFYRAEKDQLVTVRDLFEKRGDKILVICREHMRRDRIFQEIFRGHLFYYTNNKTMDDTFTIYAALSSGQDSLVLSNDYYGAYYSKMIGENRVLFRRWQLSNHIVGTGYKAFNLVFPEFTPIFQRSDNGTSIHVPISPDNNHKAFAPSGWLCLQQVNEKQKENAERIWPHREFELEDHLARDSFRMYARQVQAKSHSTKVKNFDPNPIEKPFGKSAWQKKIQTRPKSRSKKHSNDYQGYF